jgi:hypothetical protein
MWEKGRLLPWNHATRFRVIGRSSRDRFNSTGKMRASLLQGLLALAVAAPVAAQAPNLSRLTPLTLSYRVSAQGNPAGTQLMRLVRDGDGWLRTDSVTFGALHQVLTSRWGADFAPQSHTESLEGPMSGQGSVQVTEGHVRGEAHLPAQAGGDRTFDVPVSPGMLFDGQDEALLAVLDLTADMRVSFPVFKLNSGEIATHSYHVTGVESVTVPGGTFAAFRVEATGGPIPATIWLRQEGLHVPVRFELQGAPIVVELQ